MEPFPPKEEHHMTRYEYKTPPLPQKIRLYVSALLKVPFYRYGEIGNLLYTVGKNILEGVILYTMFSMAETELKVAAILGITVRYAYPGISLVSSNLISGFIDRLEALRDTSHQIAKLIKAHVGIGVGQSLGGIFLVLCLPPVFKYFFYGMGHKSYVIIALYFLHHVCDGSSQIVEGRTWFKIIEIKIRNGEDAALAKNFWVLYALSQNFQLVLGQVFLWSALAVTTPHFANLGAGNVYLYEVSTAFDAVSRRASFPKPHGASARNGPIIFEQERALLYGESAWEGYGYFHLVDSAAGNLMKQDYLVFDGGLAGVTYGHDHVIYATSGAGKKVYKIQDTTMTEVAATNDAAQSIVFDGASFYVSTQVPFTPPRGGPRDGSVRFHELWNPDPGVAITPTAPYRLRDLGHPDPPALPWNSAIGYYRNHLIYAGNDQKVYAYDVTEGDSTEVIDLSNAPHFRFGPSGFLVSHENYLYFHDNGSTDKIYRIDLAASWPPAMEALSTGASGSIFAFTQNPWTGAIWFNSADSGAALVTMMTLIVYFGLACVMVSKFILPVAYKLKLCA
jgi:hypothetical protein